jgi:hypothetical protein
MDDYFGYKPIFKKKTLVWTLNPKKKMRDYLNVTTRVQSLHPTNYD